MAYSKGRAGTAWWKVQAQVYAEETDCWWCGKWVDQDLPRTHPMSRTVDHVHEMWQGGGEVDRANCRLAHRRCNSIKSNQLRGKAKPKPTFAADPASL